MSFYVDGSYRARFNAFDEFVCRKVVGTSMQVGTGGVGAINAGAVRCNTVEVWNGSTLK